MPMVEPVTGWVADGMTRARPRRMRITVRVRRRGGGLQQVLYMFAGCVDAATLRDVLQQVRRLLSASPGRWRIECCASELDGPAREQLEAALRELQQPARPTPASGLCAELRALLARTPLTR